MPSKLPTDHVLDTLIPFPCYRLSTPKVHKLVDIHAGFSYRVVTFRIFTRGGTRHFLIFYIILLGSYVIAAITFITGYFILPFIGGFLEEGFEDYPIHYVYDLGFAFGRGYVAAAFTLIHTE